MNGCHYYSIRYLQQGLAKFLSPIIYFHYFMSKTKTEYPHHEDSLKNRWSHKKTCVKFLFFKFDRVYATNLLLAELKLSRRKLSNAFSDQLNEVPGYKQNYKYILLYLHMRCIFTSNILNIDNVIKLWTVATIYDRKNYKKSLQIALLVLITKMHHTLLLILTETEKKLNVLHI